MKRKHIIVVCKTTKSYTSVTVEANSLHQAKLAIDYYNLPEYSDPEVDSVEIIDVWQVPL